MNAHFKWLGMHNIVVFGSLEWKTQNSWNSNDYWENFAVFLQIGMIFIICSIWRSYRKYYIAVDSHILADDRVWESQWFGKFQTFRNFCFLIIIITIISKGMEIVIENWLFCNKQKTGFLQWKMELEDKLLLHRILCFCWGWICTLLLKTIEGGTQTVPKKVKRQKWTLIIMIWLFR